MPPRDIMIQMEADNRTERPFQQIIDDLKEVNRLMNEGQASPNQASRERQEGIRAEREARAAASRENIQNSRATQAADRQASQERLQNSRAYQTQSTLASRERIANLKRETDQERLAGQERSREIQRQRLEEQRLGRESRERMARLRAQQRDIAGGFSSWTGAFREFLSFFAGAALEDSLRRIARRVIDVSAEFERLRLGLAAIEGDPFVADAQLRRLRQLAELPGVGFTGGIRTISGLRGAGITFNQSERLLREISNVATLSGATQEDVTEALRQFRQAFSAGAFTQQDLRPILQRIPLLQPAFRQAFGGITAGTVNQTIRGEGLTFPDAFDRLLEALERGPRAAADTFQNAAERLSDSFDDLARDIGRDVLPILRDVYNALNGFLQFLRTPIGRTALTAIGGAAAFGGVRLAGAGLSSLAGLAGFGGARAASSILGPSGPVLRLFPNVYTQSFGDEFREARGVARRRGLGFFGSNRFAFNAAVGSRGVVPALRRPVGSYFTRPVGTGAQLAGAGIIVALTGQSIAAVERGIRGEGGGILGFLGGAGTGNRPVLGREFQEFQNITDSLSGLGSITADFTQNVNRLRRAISEAGDSSRLSTVTLNAFGEAFGVFRQGAQDGLRALETQRRTADEELRLLRRSANRSREEFLETEIPRVRVQALRAGEQFTEEDEEALRRSTGILDRLSESERERIRVLEEEIRVIEEQYLALQRSVEARRAEAREIQGELVERAQRAREPLVDEEGRFLRLRPNEAVRVQDAPRPESANIGAGLNFEPSQVNQPFNINQPRRRAQIRRGLLTEPRNIPGVPENRGLILPTRPGDIFGPDVDTPFGRFRELNRVMNEVADSAGALTRRLQPLGRVTGAFTTGNQFGLGYTAPQGTLPPYRSLVPGVLGQQTLDQGLLDPNAITELTQITRRLSEEWVSMADALRDVIGSGSREEVMQTGRELRGMAEDLQDVRTEFEALGGIPSPIATILQSAIDQVNDALQRTARRLDEINNIRAQLNEDAVNEAERLRGRLTLEEQQEVRRRTFGTPTGEPPTREQISNLPFFQSQRRERRARQQRRAQAFAGFFESGAESLYDQFIAPSILDAVGIGSGQTRARERAIEQLTTSIEEARREVRENELLNERQQQEELLEINREYEREKRSIQRQYEEERNDAWANWVRQQLTDFPKLIFQQLNLQLAARATNAALNALGIGGGVPITGPGIGGGFGGGGDGLSFFDRIGSFFGGGGTPALSGYGSPSEIGAGLGQAAGNVVGTGATAGTVASFALAAHNVYTGIRSGLFDDIGIDIANLNPFGGGNDNRATPIVVSSDTQLNINQTRNDQVLQQDIITMGDLVNEGRAANPFRDI